MECTIRKPCEIDNCPRCLRREIESLKTENTRLREALEICLPIVDAAYWDHHTAGTLPGAGYNNKAQHLAGQQWGWRSSDKYTDWRKALKERK